jgi:DNA-binding response OmpR family regulator
MRVRDLPIVLVEKDPAQATEIRDSLTSRGRMLHIVESLRSADFRALTLNPCLVVLDIDHADLPQADADEIVDLISTGDVRRAVILAELSLFPDLLDLLRGSRIRLLSKPFEADELAAALDA